MVLPPIDWVFEEMYDQAKGHLELNGLHALWDFTDGLTKSQWVERKRRELWGSMVTKDGQLIIPHLGIHPKL